MNMNVCDSRDNVDFDEDVGCCLGKMGCGLGLRWKLRFGFFLLGDCFLLCCGDFVVYVGKWKM